MIQVKQSFSYFVGAFADWLAEQHSDRLDDSMRRVDHAHITRINQLRAVLALIGVSDGTNNWRWEKQLKTSDIFELREALPSRSTNFNIAFPYLLTYFLNSIWVSNVTEVQRLL